MINSSALRSAYSRAVAFAIAEVAPMTSTFMPIHIALGLDRGTGPALGNLHCIHGCQVNPIRRDCNDVKTVEGSMRDLIFRNSSHLG